jgi:hypothetical protein
VSPLWSDPSKKHGVRHEALGVRRRGHAATGSHRGSVDAVASAPQSLTQVSPFELMQNARDLPVERIEYPY